MKTIKTMILALTISLFGLGSTTLKAEKCSSPCEVEVTNGFGNGVLQLISELAGSGSWELKPRVSPGLGTTGKSFAINEIGDSAQFLISGEASPNTLVVDSAGRIGINTIDTSDELTINAFSPAIRLNDISTGAIDFNIGANSNAFTIEDAFGNDLLKMNTTVGSVNTVDSLVVNSSGDVNLANGSVFVDRSSNRVGIGTVNPQANINIQPINSTILFGDSGNGWALDSGTDFRISTFQGGVSNKLTIKPDNKVGIGTTTPASTLHLRRTDAQLTVEAISSTASNRQLVNLRNKGGIGMRMNNTDNGSVWDFSNTNSGNFTASKVGTGGFEFEVQGNGRTKIRSFGTLIMDMQTNGNLLIPEGDVIVSGTTLNVPDYVFEHDYELMPLDELKSFVKKNKHLPNVASEAEIKKSKQVSMAKSHMKHLEKIEELTLYTIDQHEQIKSLKSELAEQKMTLKAENSSLKERLASLERLVTDLAMGTSQIKKGDKVALK